MNIDDFDFDEQDQAEADALRERKLLQDEQPLGLDGADDCGDACRI